MVEGYLLFVFLSFGSYWLIVTWCIVLLLHPLPSVFLGLFVHLPFSFSASWLRHKSWGGVGGGISSGLGNRTVASSDRSCISSASFGIQVFYC